MPRELSAVDHGMRSSYARGMVAAGINASASPSPLPGVVVAYGSCSCREISPLSFT